MRWTGVLVGLAALVGWAGCNRQPTPAEHADAEPPVVVESPGASPEPADPELADNVAEGATPDEAAPGRVEIVSTAIPCQQDSDCVKATCCHATTCVAASARPDCSATACTADCRAGTMDCNAGCLCQAGTCAAKLWWPQSN
jgi:hypothetical protein